MSDPFMSMINMTGFNWAPEKYALCNGQIMNISDNTALFALIGDKFGGDGAKTYGLPDLQGRTPVGVGEWGEEYPRGRAGGQESVVLTENNLPSHSHRVMCQPDTSATTVANPEGKTYSPTIPQARAYSTLPTNYVDLHPAALPTATGGNAPHTNMQPYTVINFIIAVSGHFPLRS